MDSSLRQRLYELSQKCEKLSKNGKYDQCIDIMEEIVSIKRQVYGMDHRQFQNSTQKLCEYLNLAAMVYLQKQKFQICLDYLRKAQLVARNSIEFKATTFNNLACFYRRTGKIRTALTYLIQALQLQLKIEQPKTLADTHLNLCAVLSQLDRHDDALQHVMLSIILLQDQFLTKLLPKQQQSDQKMINDERLAVLTIAYHNMGVQFEHLKRFQQAVKIYKKALNLSKDYLSDNSQLIENLQRVVQSATEQISDKKIYNNEMKRHRVQREFSESKHNIYKQFSRQSDRLKNLPKLKINKEGLRDSYTEKGNKYLGRNQNEQKRQAEQFLMERASRSFASRKHPRYYKSYAVPSQHQERSVSSQQNSRRQHQGSIPVSEGLKAFNPT